jgi:hypothetical protein
MKMMRKVEEGHRADFKAKWHALNAGLDEDFGMITQKMERISALTEEAAAEAERAHERLNGLDLERMPKWQRDNRHGMITPPPRFNWSALSREEQAELVDQITAKNLDLPSISRSVGLDSYISSPSERMCKTTATTSCPWRESSPMGLSQRSKRAFANGKPGETSHPWSGLDIFSMDQKTCRPSFSLLVRRTSYSLSAWICMGF